MYLDEKSFTSPPVESNPDVYALPTLIAWLEKRPANQQYCYEHNGECLLSQYFISAGFTNVCMYTDGFLHGDRRKYNPGRESCGKSITRFPIDFNSVAIKRPRTFGAALSRARALLP